MRRLETGEIVALHATGKALTDGRSGHVDFLPRHEMVDGDLVTDVEHRVFADAEFDQPPLGLDLRLGVMPTHRL